MPENSPSHAAPPRALIRALRHALRPLVKLMLARGMTFTFASELLKSLFVEVADRDFRLDGKAHTDSRVSLVSGVHRKEVSRLRGVLHAGEEAMPEAVSLGAQVVAQWMGAAPYVDKSGQPRPLARFASEGGELSFEALVARVNRDIRPRVVLDEWLRLGVVEIGEDGRIHLQAGAFVPTKGFDEMSFYFGHNVHDHAAAATHNLLGGEPGFLERSVHYDGLSADAVAQLAQQAGTLGMEALVAVNKKALALARRSGTGTQPPQRMTFGVYFYAEPAQEDAANAVPAPAQAAPAKAAKGAKTAQAAPARTAAKATRKTAGKK